MLMQEFPQRLTVGAVLAARVAALLGLHELDTGRIVDSRVRHGVYSPALAGIAIAKQAIIRRNVKPQHRRIVSPARSYYSATLRDAGRANGIWEEVCRHDLSAGHRLGW